jgi:imidazolonepropionase
MKLTGPFTQLLTLSGLPLHGRIGDDQLEVIPDAGVLVEAEQIIAVGNWKALQKAYPQAKRVELVGERVAIPGLIDAHTHICFAGSRAMDFAARNAGISYLEIAAAGGGIWSTVTHTRQASQEQLTRSMLGRMDRLLSQGVTTVEVKSGYGLNAAEELKMLRAIKAAAEQHPLDVVPTCLAAHMKPRDFSGSNTAYLDYLLQELVPIIAKEGLAKRFDIFVEQSAFSPEEARPYLQALQQRGFDITIHGDQFTTGGSQLAVELNAHSVDHLEVSGQVDIDRLAKSSVVPVVLPGATIGLGCEWAPARKLLDAGCSLAIASDWNPGSGPQGHLLAQAAILATFEKLTTAEVLAGITQRAAHALRRSQVGTLQSGFLADFISFPCADYREILYQQGMMPVAEVWKGGEQIR